MPFWNRDVDGDGEKDFEGTFAWDDEFRQKLDDMSNKDEAIELLDVLGKHEQAIRNAVEMLDALDRSGVFEAVTALVDQDAPEPDLSTRSPMVRNLYRTGKELQTMDGDAVDSFIQQLPADLAQVTEDMQHPPKFGPLTGLKAMNDPDVKRGIGKVLVLLKAFGQAGDDRG